MIVAGFFDGNTAEAVTSSNVTLGFLIAFAVVAAATLALAAYGEWYRWRHVRAAQRRGGMIDLVGVRPDETELDWVPETWHPGHYDHTDAA